MSEVENWHRRYKRAGEIAAELWALSEEQKGPSTAEVHFTRALKTAHRQVLMAVDSADIMVKRVGWEDLPTRPNGPNPTCRAAIAVRFALDILGWTLRTAAERCRMTNEHFRQVRDGKGTPEQIEQVLRTLSKQELPMHEFIDLVASYHARLNDKTRAAAVTEREPSVQAAPLEETRPTIIYEPPPTGDDDERPLPPSWT